MNINEIKSQIFQLDETNFEKVAISLFHWQAQNIEIYKRFIKLIGIDSSAVQQITDIPFLPIQFFKTHAVIAEHETQIETIFESSGTTGQINSKHLIRDISLYENSFSKAFEIFFGKPSNHCILGLLPSYLERGSSSLVYMVNHFIENSPFSESGFYLYEDKELATTIIRLEEKKQKTLLIGVTYALLDFAEKFPMKLKYVGIMETGGMKGRRSELLRSEVHQILKKQFQVETIYSEYGMTELLSQAYSLADEIFQSPPWMKILVRELNDPFQIKLAGKGAVNIIDLANLYSCAFIATDDLGEVYENSHFKINGRKDSSDLRGCSLMISEY